MGAHCGGAFVGSTFGPVPIVPGTTGFDRAMPSHTPQYVFPSDSQTACRLQRPLPSWIDGFPPTAVPEPIVSPSASTTPPEFVGSAGSHDGVCNVHQNPRNITNRYMYKYAAELVEKSIQLNPIRIEIPVCCKEIAIVFKVFLAAAPSPSYPP